MNKKADFVMPGWLLMVILMLIIFGIIVVWIITSYKGGLEGFVQENIIGPLGG